jgi:hypothetical protein
VALGVTLSVAFGAGVSVALVARVAFGRPEQNAGQTGGRSTPARRQDRVAAQQVSQTDIAVEPASVRAQASCAAS